MAPGLSPNPELHPPQVLETVEAVRDEARIAAQAEVVVSTLAESPGSVALFLQGRRVAVGSTGRFALRLIPGEYQLRVGMDGVEGPVWHLKLNASDRRVINVDRLRTRLFDRGHPLFWRATKGAGAGSDQPPGSVAALAELLELDAVVIASRRDPQTLLLERYTLTGQSWTVSARAEIGVELRPDDDENVAPAVETLLR
jgi:hypothetical protein